MLINTFFWHRWRWWLVTTTPCKNNSNCAHPSISLAISTLQTFFRLHFVIVLIVWCTCSAFWNRKNVYFYENCPPFCRLNYCTILLLVPEMAYYWRHKWILAMNDPDFAKKKWINVTFFLPNNRKYQNV